MKPEADELASHAGVLLHPDGQQSLALRGTPHVMCGTPFIGKRC